MQVEAVGMVWYKPENYQRLKAMFEDGQKLHATYEEWLAAAELGRSTLEEGGKRVVCVDIDPDEFPKWCRSKGMRFNAAARNAFANLMAYRTVAGKQQS